MMIFDVSILEWREQTEADKTWGAEVVKNAFPELIKETKQ